MIMTLSEEDKKLFENAVKVFSNKLGLSSAWYIYVEHVEHLEDHVNAQVNMNFVRHAALIELSSKYEVTLPQSQYKKDIVQTALHEVLHILLYPIAYFSEDSGNKDAMYAAEHAVINTLVNKTNICESCVVF